MSFLQILQIQQKKQWKCQRVDKASKETINKVYAEYKQCELNKNGEKRPKALRKHAYILSSNEVSQVTKIKDVKKLQQDIENDQGTR